MAEQVVDSMLVKLRGDGTEHEKMWQEAQRSMMAGAKAAQRSAQIMENAFSLIKAALPIALIKQTFSKAVGAFSEAEEVSLKLKATLEGNGRAVDALMGDYQKFAESMQRVTRLDDDAVLGLLQVAETMGLTGDAAKRAAQNAIGLAAARGIDAKSALRMTAALEQGRAEMLQRYFPALRNIKDQSKKVAQAHELLGKTFGVAKASAQGMAGQSDQLSNALGNLWEDLGEVLVEFVKPMVSWLKDVATAFKDMVGPIKEASAQFVKSWMFVFDWFKLGFAAIVGFFWNFKENSANISQWWMDNWQLIIKAVSTAFVNGVSAMLSNAWVTFEYYATEFIIWGTKTGQAMVASFSKSFLDDIKWTSDRAFEMLVSALDPEQGDALRKSREALQRTIDKGIKEKREREAKEGTPVDKEAEARLKASQDRMKNIAAVVSAPFAGLVLPHINIKNPLLDALIGPKPEETVNEAKKVGDQVKKALPFYGENEAVRRGTSQYHAAIKSTMKLLAKAEAQAPLPVGGKGGPAKPKATGGAMAAAMAAGRAVAKAAKGGGIPREVLETAEKYFPVDGPERQAWIKEQMKKYNVQSPEARAAARVASGQAAMSARDQSAQARSIYDRRHKQAVDRVTASGVEQKTKTDLLLEQIRDALVKRKGNEIILVPSEAGG